VGYVHVIRPPDRNKNMKNTIHKGDCLELMKQIPDGSVDMILCDLPYGTTACKWDVIIPFEPLWEQYKRIIKSNGAIVLTASQPFTSALVMSNPKMFKYEWIWEKNKVSGLIKNQPIRAFENVLVFYSSPPVWNEIKIKRTEHEYKMCKRENDSISIGSQHRPNYTNILIRKSSEEQWYKKPINILQFSSDDKRSGDGHPTQKPVALFEYLIKTYTNEGETVLDNCAGSGTTAIACLNTNRNYILMEQEQKYFEMIENRIAKWHSEREPKGLFKQAI